MTSQGDQGCQSLLDKRGKISVISFYKAKFFQ